MSQSQLTMADVNSFCMYFKRAMTRFDQHENDRALRMIIAMFFDNNIGFIAVTMLNVTDEDQEAYKGDVNPDGLYFGSTEAVHWILHRRDLMWTWIER